MPRELGAPEMEMALAGGRVLGTAAIHAGRPMLLHPDELPEDAIVATAAAIGALGEPTAWDMRGVHYVRVAELLQAELGQKIAGFMIGQNGMSSTLNGWLPAVMLRAVVLDAVGDIRAHPTGDTGSLVMLADPAPTIQSAAGGNRAEGRYIEMVCRGPTARISPILRTAGRMAGGFIASCRNPMPNAFVKQRAAVGGISYALELGAAILAAGRGRARGDRGDLRLHARAHPRRGARAARSSGASAR